ncbi:hypothetical protein I4U23_011865 [Adineta vaga]|nr:hypothetical protein I4U23_011865 [Adineta vaga]
MSDPTAIDKSFHLKSIQYLIENTQVNQSDTRIPCGILSESDDPTGGHEELQLKEFVVEIFNYTNSFEKAAAWYPGPTKRRRKLS